MAPQINKKLALTPKSLAQGGIIAALYAALTLLFAPISFGDIQFRVAEALTLLPILTPSAVPGLFVGCLIANLLASGVGWMDVVFGSLATLLAAVLTRQLRRFNWLAALMPVLANGLIVGGVLSHVLSLPFLPTACTVALGEAAVCYMLGLPLINLLRTRVDAKYFED